MVMHGRRPANGPLHGGGCGSDELVQRAAQRAAQLLAASWLGGLGTAGVYGLRQQYTVVVAVTNADGGCDACAALPKKADAEHFIGRAHGIQCHPTTVQLRCTPPIEMLLSPHLCASQATWAIMVSAERASRSSSTGRTNGTRRSRASLPSCLAAGSERGWKGGRHVGGWP